MLIKLARLKIFISLIYHLESSKELNYICFMQVFRFHRNQLNRFDDQHLNMVYDQAVYSPYINHIFSFKNFEKQIEEKRDNYSGRTQLVEAIKHQYIEFESLDKVGENILALGEENTFTVTTGHQLSLFTGPLYFVIKILHVIKLSEELKVRYPEMNFVPVFWMATEDHDFEEIRSTNLFGKQLLWDSGQTGAVGRFGLGELDVVKTEIAKFFENHPDAEIHNLLNEYSGANLAEATRKLVHKMFKSYGLVIIDGDDPRLKKQFLPIVEKELKEEFSYKAVLKVNDRLKRDGGKIQVNPREINLFYLENGIRSRIIKNGDVFEVDEVGTFSEEALLEELKNHPERFSPNVILRPLYQETILPNLAYVGGVGEMSYWLQLKGVFDTVNCTYPLIDVRNSVMWIDRGTSKRMSKIDLHIEDTFKNTDLNKKEYVEQNSNGDLDFSELDTQTENITRIIEELILNVDSGKQQYADGEIIRMKKQINLIKEKMIKHSKSKHSDAMSIIEGVKNKLFPNDSLQERYANFFSFCPDGNYSGRLQALYNALDPEENDFIVLREL